MKLQIDWSNRKLNPTIHYFKTKKTAPKWSRWYIKYVRSIYSKIMNSDLLFS